MKCQSDKMVRTLHFIKAFAWNAAKHLQVLEECLTPQDVTDEGQSNCVKSGVWRQIMSAGCTQKTISPRSSRCVQALSMTNFSVIAREAKQSHVWKGKS